MIDTLTIDFNDLKKTLPFYDITQKFSDSKKSESINPLSSKGYRKHFHVESIPKPKKEKPKEKKPKEKETFTLETSTIVKTTTVRPQRTRKRKGDHYEFDEEKPANSLSKEEHWRYSKILKTLSQTKHGWIFGEPVDPVKLKIPDYFNIIKNPMDFGTIKSRIEKEMYTNENEVISDIELVFSNAFTYNPQDSDVYHMAETLSKMFYQLQKEYQEKTEEKKRKKEDKSSSV